MGQELLCQHHLGAIGKGCFFRHRVPQLMLNHSALGHPPAANKQGYAMLQLSSRTMGTCGGQRKSPSFLHSHVL